MAIVDRVGDTCTCPKDSKPDFASYYCVYDFVIALKGLTKTSVMPVGPAILQEASVTRDNVGIPGKTVTVRIASPSGIASVSGTTDAVGKFFFQFIPPNKPANSQISATCTGCGNTATKTVTVDPLTSCAASDFAGEAGSTVGNPISPADGSKIQVETDFVDSAAHRLSFTRHYRSTAGMPGSELGAGAIWSHTYSGQIQLSADGLEASIKLGGGLSVHFTRESTATPWIAAPNAVSTERLVQTATQFIYGSGGNDGQYAFDAISGNLVAIVERNGWTMNLSYSLDGKLARVNNAFGRSLFFSFNASGQIASVTAPDGQTIGYQYDGMGRLLRAQYADGVAKTYLYEVPDLPYALTGIFDENNQRFSTYSYEGEGRAFRSTNAGGASDTFISYYGNAAASGIFANGGLALATAPVAPALFQSTVMVSNALGNSRTITYQGGDGGVRVLGSSSPLEGGTFASRQFEGSLPVSETDYLGVTAFFSWDAARRLKTSETRAGNRPEAQTTSTQWHPAFRVPVLVTKPGKTTAYTYDALGNRLTQTETDTTGGPSNGQVRNWSWTYNPQGLPVTLTDPLGRVTQFAYDAGGNVSSQTNALGQATQYQSDAAGRVTRSTAPNGLQTSYAYDQRGRLQQHTRGANLVAVQHETTLYTYTPSGQLGSFKLPGGFQVNFVYDVAQRLVGAQDNRGNSITYSLDGMGNRTREEVKDASGAIAMAIDREINNLNRVASSQSASGSITYFAYDPNGEPTLEVDRGAQVTRTLDGLRRTTATTTEADPPMLQAWNQLNQLTQTTDPKGVVTQYVRNAWGETLSEASADIGTMVYQRNAVGSVTSKTDAKGQVSAYQYDAIDRLTQVNLPDNTVQAFTYDGSFGAGQTGFLRQITDSSGSTSYERDAFGRVSKKTQTVNDNPAAPSTLVTRYAFANGQLAQITYPSGLNVFYQRGASGMVTGIDTQRPSTSILRTPAITPLISTLAYNGVNQPKSWAWNCITGSLYTPAIQNNCDNATRSFDSNGRLVSNEFANYAYGSFSRISGIAQSLWSSLVTSTADPVTGAVTSSTSLYQTSLQWYSILYDNRSRLIAFTRAGNAQNFTYDVNGNRTTSVTTKRADTDLDGEFEDTERAQTTTQNLNLAAQSNRLLGFNQSVVTTKNYKTLSTVNSQVVFPSDAAGNQLGDGLRKFDYNSENRHSKTGIHDSDEGAKTTYLYNALGQRVFKSEPQVDYTAPNEAVLGTDFVTWLKNNFKWLFATAQGNASLGSSYAYAEADANLPAWALLGEYNNGSASGTGRTEYIWLPTEDGSAIPVGMYRSNRYWNIHSDHLGTPRLVTDDTAKPVWQLPYSAFGDNKPMGVLSATTNPNTAISAAPLLKATSPAVVLNLRFPGQYWDSETNLNYNLNRTYQPTTGRYTQADPIGLEGGWNRYAYVDGNPLWASDPEGLAWQNNLREIAFCILCLANNRRIPPPPPPPPPVMAPRPAVPDKCS